jgi:hypothetical protein
MGDASFFKQPNKPVLLEDNDHFSMQYSELEQRWLSPQNSAVELTAV